MVLMVLAECVRSSVFSCDFEDSFLRAEAATRYLSNMTHSGDVLKLKMQLEIPNLPVASACHLPSAQVNELRAATTAAQLTLGQAAATAIRAQAKAGANSSTVRPTNT